MNDKEIGGKDLTDGEVKQGKTAEPPAPLNVDHLYKAHFRELCANVRKVFGAGPPEAEDLVQEAFAKFSAIENHSKIQHPRAFIYRTAINLGLNSIKRIKTARRFIEEALREVGEPILEENSPEDVYSYKERLGLSSDAIKTLTPKQREILVRSRLRGQTYAEISAETGWSQADISRQLNAAIAQLQDALRDK